MGVSDLTLRDLWSLLRFYGVPVLVPAGILGVLLVHFPLCLALRRKLGERFTYTRDMLALKLVLSVTYWLLFADSNLVSIAGGPTSAFVVMLLLHAIVRSSFAVFRTRRIVMALTELLMIAAEFFVITALGYAGMYIFPYGNTVIW